jgi:hypothetical protein
MVYKQDPTYLWLKGNTYYFNRHIPFDIQPHYKSSRVVICLKTACRVRAKQAARSIAQRLEDYWMSLRLANLDIPACTCLETASEGISILLYDSVRGSRTLSKAEGCQ